MTLQTAWSRIVFVGLVLFVCASGPTFGKTRKEWLKTVAAKMEPHHLLATKDKRYFNLLTKGLEPVEAFGLIKILSHLKRRIFHGNHLYWWREHDPVTVHGYDPVLGPSEQNDFVTHDGAIDILTGIEKGLWEKDHVLHDLLVSRSASATTPHEEEILVRGFQYLDKVGYLKDLPKFE